MTSRQIWIDGTDSRSVCINEQEGHYWANLYVNYRETITAIYRRFKTEAGARRWAAKQLQS